MASPTTYYNISLPFKKGRLGYFDVNTNIVDAIKQDVTICMFTPKGSRVIYKNFGTNIQALLFEPQTQDLKNSLTTEVYSIVKWVRGIQITQVDVLFMEDITPSSQYYGIVNITSNEVFVAVYYTITNPGSNFLIPQQSISFVVSGNA